MNADQDNNNNDGANNREDGRGANANPNRQPPARTSLSTVAARLIADYSLGPFTANTATDLVHIKLSAASLYSTYANTLKPIVYGNFRNIGARTLSESADTTLLDSVVATVATNACVASYSVLLNKCIKEDASMITEFGRHAHVDSLRFPALTTLLVNSLGPVQTDTQPYRCKFLPYLVWTEIETLLAGSGYKSSYQEIFNTAMQRGRTIQMTDVDVNNNTSSHWWTLYTNNHIPTVDASGNPALQRRNTLSVYCPFRFAERDDATVLGAVALETTLYEAPGPIISAVIGPFATISQPRTIDDIPKQFRNSLAVNSHYPARLILFDKVCRMTNAHALAFGDLQQDEAIYKLASAGCTSESVNAPTFEENVEFTEYSDNKKRKIDASSLRTVTLTTSTSTKPGITEQVNNTQAKLYYATILYFDHHLVRDVTLHQRNAIITSANQAV